MSEPSGCPAPARRSIRALAAVAAVAITAGCATKQRPLDDREQVVRAVLAQLVSDGKPACVDDRSEGNALAVFREMTLAPRPSRTELHWYPPRPLRPPTRVRTADLRGAELHNEQFEIEEPAPRTDALPGLAQYQLSAAARGLLGTIGEAEEDVDLRRAWMPPGVTARWWLLNRFRKDCWPLYSVSNAVLNREVGFVTLSAEHWGALYAVRKDKGRWSVVAEWSRWLY